MAEDEQTGQALKTRFLAPEIKSGKKYESQWLFKKRKIQGNYSGLDYLMPAPYLLSSHLLIISISCFLSPCVLHLHRSPGIISIS